MAKIKDTQNISQARNEFTDNLEHPGVIPITRNGNFSGVLISIGENDDATAQRLHDLLRRNPKAAIETLRQKALKEQ